jgi:uncharacterized integral membrane protein (TIGR00698 family)
MHTSSKSLSLLARGQVLIQLTGAGLGLTSGLAVLANFLRTLPGFNLFSPLILAIVLGILVRNTFGVSPIFKQGIMFSLKKVLRLGIILLGIQLSLTEITQVGAAGLFIVVATMVATFLFTCWLGKRLGINRQLTHLVAMGTTICGASAIVAGNTVVEGTDEDVAYAVGVITTFGTASLVVYPLLFSVLNLTPEMFGIWCGASIHEVAQAIAAAFQGGMVSGQIGTVAKLSRVVFLAPSILLLGLLSAKLKSQQAGTTQSLSLKQLPIPWFLLGFIIILVLNSFNFFPENFKTFVVQGNQIILAIALAAMGLETSLLRIVRTGIKPLYLGFASWLFVSLFSLGLIQLLA